MLLADCIAPALPLTASSFCARPSAGRCGSMPPPEPSGWLTTCEPTMPSAKARSANAKPCASLFPVSAAASHFELTGRAAHVAWWTTGSRRDRRAIGNVYGYAGARFLLRSSRRIARTSRSSFPRAPAAPSSHMRQTPEGKSLCVRAPGRRSPCRRQLCRTARNSLPGRPRNRQPGIDHDAGDALLVATPQDPQRRRFP